MAQVPITAGNPGRTHVRWTHIAFPLLVMFMACQIGKGQFGYLAADHPFLAQMHLVGQPALLGLLTTAYLFAFGIGILFWSMFIERWGPKKMVMLGIVLWCGFLVLGGVATNFTEISISRIGFGFAAALAWPIPNTFTARWFPLHERATTNAVWFLGSPLGLAVGGAVLPALLVGSGWRWTFFFTALVGLVIALPLIAFLTQDHPNRHSAASPEEVAYIQAGLLGRQEHQTSIVSGAGATRRNIVTNYRFWLTTVCFLVVSLQVWGVFSWAPAYLHTHMGLKATGGVLTAVYLLAIVVGLAVSRWSDRLLRRTPFCVASNLLVALLIWLSTLFPQTGVMGGVFVASSIIFTLGVGTPSTISMLHSIAQDQVMGFASGLMTGVGNILASLGPFIMGLLIGAQANFSAAFMFVAVVSLVGAGAAAILWPSRI